jgi:hypothetical protein
LILLWLDGFTVSRLTFSGYQRVWCNPEPESTLSPFVHGK